MAGFAVKLVGDWGKALRICGSMMQKLEQTQKRAVLQEAHFLRGEVVKGIREGAPGGKEFKPLSPETLAIRKFEGFGGTKPLIRRGDLRNSIVVKSVGDMVFVGVLRTARGKDGQALVNVAETHEFGRGPFVVPITPKSRRFYHAALAKAGLASKGGGHGGGGVAVAIVTIPARPFLTPVFEKFCAPDQIKARFEKRMRAIFE